MAQIDPAHKNRISHRARALALAEQILPHGLGRDQADKAPAF